MPYKFRGKTFEWRTVTASGYGYTTHVGSLSSVLRKVDLQVVPIDACMNFWDSLKNHINENNTCAYGMPLSESGVCKGDSGKKNTEDSTKKRGLERVSRRANFVN